MKDKLMPGSHTNNPRIIIIAAGDATRWNNYLGVPKHYAIIEGEPVIERTVRLLLERNQDDIWVVSKDYEIDNVHNWRPKLNPRNLDADKFLSSIDLWDETKRTLIIYGDVYFTEDAIDQILQNDSDLYRMFCRPKANRKNKYPYGECFAASFHPHDHAFIKYNLKRLIHLYRADVLDRIGGWELTRLMAGVPIGQIHAHKYWLLNYFVIDDLTNDLDYPADFNAVCAAIKKRPRKSA